MKSSKTKQTASSISLQNLAIDNKEKSSFVSTGFDNIDRLIGGWKKGELIVVASRPAMGRTAFLLSMLQRIGLEKTLPTCFFSFDHSLPTEGVFTRLQVLDTEISNKTVSERSFTFSELKRVDLFYQKSSKSKILIDDDNYSSFKEFSLKCRSLKNETEIELIIIDGIENVDFILNSVTKMCLSLQKLKSLAVELNLPIIVSSNLPKSVEKRTKSKPRISDLNKLGDFEKYADNINFIYRPEYYGIVQNKKGQSNEGVAYFINVKDSKNAIGKVKLRFKGEYGKLEEF
jgi:replicative DNA helicase